MQAADSPARTWKVAFLYFGAAVVTLSLLIWLAYAFLHGDSKRSTSDPIVVFSDAMDLKTSKKDNVRTLRYRLSRDYPATDVTKAVSALLDKMGYVANSQASGAGMPAPSSMGWVEFTDGRRQGAPLMKRWFQTWNGPKGDWVIYVLEYPDFATDPQGLIVTGDWHGAPSPFPGSGLNGTKDLSVSNSDLPPAD